MSDDIARSGVPPKRRPEPEVDPPDLVQLVRDMRERRRIKRSLKPMRSLKLMKPSVKGPGRVQQWLRTLSAVIAALALVVVGLGVLVIAEESMEQTDLDQQQNTILACHSEQEGAYDLLALAAGDGGVFDLALEFAELRALFNECRTAVEVCSGERWQRLRELFRECRDE